MRRNFIIKCLVTIFLTFTITAQGQDPKPYENWPANDQEWNTLTNHIMWCYNQLRDRECVATGRTNNFLGTSDRVRVGTWEPSLICPFRDYCLIMREIDSLAPFFINHTLAGDGDFDDYFSTTNKTGRCPSEFPRWTPESLHSNAFGRLNWSTNSALTIWMAVTNRAFIAEVTAAINFLKWTPRYGYANGFENYPEDTFSWYKGANVAVGHDTYVNDCSALRSEYNNSFYSWSGTDDWAWRGRLEVEIYNETYWYPQGIRLQMWSEYNYGFTFDAVEDGELMIDNYYYRLGHEGNPYVFNPETSVFIRRYSYWVGYTPSPAVVGRKNVFFCQNFNKISPDAKLVTYENPIAEEVLQLDPLSYSEIDNPSVYRSPFVPVKYVESVDYYMWVMKWTFNEFPQDKLPAATPAETPDVEMDGIVETMSTDGLPGAETGTFIVNPADESPIMYLPLSFDATWASKLSGKAYLSQGANNKLPYHFMPWIERGSEWPMEMPVCKFPFVGLNTFHYNLNTCVLEFNILTNAQTHIKQAVVLRPRGEVVVFDFPWDGTSFSTNGYPIGINRDRDYVLYHDRQPNSDEDLKGGILNLLFSSGIGHRFGQGHWTRFSQPTPINMVFNDDGMISYYFAQSGEYFDDEFCWSSTLVTQELAAVTGCVYRATVEWKKGLPTQVTYHSLTTGELCEKVTLEYTDGCATCLDKIDPVAESMVLSDNSILYGTGVKQVRTQVWERKTGRTVSIKTFDSEGATTPCLTETTTYDNYQRMSNRSRTAGGRSASYNYTYKNESSPDQRYPETGLLVRNSVSTYTRNGSFGSFTETYDYTPQQGWPSLISYSLGGGETKETVMGYYSASEVVPPIPLNCPKVPLRGISLKYTEQKLNGNSYGKVFHSSTNSSSIYSSYTKMSEVCHKSDSLFGDTENLSYTNGFKWDRLEFYEPLPDGDYAFGYGEIIYPSYYKSPASEWTMRCFLPNLITNAITDLWFYMSDDSTWKDIRLNARGVPLSSVTMTKEGATLEESVTYVDARGRPEYTYFMDGTSIYYFNYCVHGPQTIFNRDFSETTIKYDPFGRIKKRVDGETGITTEYEYDPNGNVIKKTRAAGTLKAESFATYGLDGELLYSKDESGHEATITGQNNNGYQVLTRTETGMAPVTETYWADGVLKSITGPGALMRFNRERGVTDDKYWVKTENPDNTAEWSTQWHEYNGLYAYTEQPGGVTNAVAYDEKLRPKSDVSADKVKSLVTYDNKYSWLPSVSGVSLSGDAQINLTSDPYCVSNSYAFTSQGLKTTQYSFPEDNSATPFEEGYTQVSPDGRTGTFSVQGRNGSFSCNAAPSTGTYTKTVNLPGGGIATSTYSKFLLREETLQEAGTLRKVTKTYQYDKFNRMETYTTDERGFKETVKVIRDPAKGLVSNINSSSRGSISVTHENDLVKQITAPSGTTTFGWKGNGSIDSVQQDLGPKFSREEDAFGRDKSITRQNEGLSSVLDFSYGNDGGFEGKKRDNVPKIAVTSRRADGRPKSVKLPDNIIVTTDFDGAGRGICQTWTDPTNTYATVAFTYSWMRDGTLRRHGQVGGPAVSNSVIRANGQITSDTSCFGNQGTPDASVQTCYDQTYGTPSLVTAQFGGFAEFSLAAAATHDAFGHLIALYGDGFTNVFTCASGGQVTNTLTAVGSNCQLSRSVIWSAQAGKPARVDYVVNGQFLRRWQYAFTNGLIASVSRSGGDGYRTAYAYDGAKQLISATSTGTNGVALPGLSFAYEYNLAGDTLRYGRVGKQNTAISTSNDLQTVRLWGPYVHILGRVSASNTTVAAYTSFSTNRIPSTVVDGLFYSVNDLGNLSTAAFGVATVVATPQSGTGDTACVAFSVPASYEEPAYNGRGMILSDSRRQYSWDAAERLLSISNSGVSNAVRLAFQYYPDGRRAQKTVSCFTNNAWTVTRSLHYAWQGWKLAAECERDGTGNITAVRHFVWGPDIAGQQTASLESGAEGVGGLLLIREWKPGLGIKQYLPLTDGLGNVCGLLDATDGSLAAEYDYDPYGGPMIERGIANDSCPFRHRTRYYDSESWLYYYGYRYYDPSTTKWISKDPLAEAGGWNLTCFCGNDPVNNFDPTGLDTDFGVRVGVQIGWDGSKGWKGIQVSSVSIVATAQQDMGDYLRTRMDAGYRMYFGGLGNSKDPERYGTLIGGGEYDLWLSGSVIAGSGETDGRPAYTGNLFAQSALDDTFEYSVTFGQTLNWHSALGLTQIGHMQAAGSDWYFHYNNDVNKFPSFGQFPFFGKEGTDYSWTAGAILGARIDDDEWYETGYACFTGPKISDMARDSVRRDGRSKDGYYRQLPREQSFNRSEWFVRGRRGEVSGMFSFSTPDWLNGQHKVHDATFPFIGPLGSETSRRFIHDEERVSLELGFYGKLLCID